jgi:hypothetical protein
MSEASSMTLRQRLATVRACEPADVGPWALMECVSPWKRPQYQLARWIQPKAFAQDVGVVEDALNSTRPEQVKLAITDCKARHKPVSMPDFSTNWSCRMNCELQCELCCDGQAPRWQ